MSDVKAVDVITGEVNVVDEVSGELGTPYPARGLKGDKGDKGDKGEQGEQGIQGEKGDTGATGDQGEKGDTGDKGEKGDAFTYADFTPEQLAGLKGDKGDKGDTGEQGIQGEKGDKGDPGTTDYNALENRPTIPTKVSELTNDSGYQTAAGSVAIASRLVPRNTESAIDFGALALCPWGRGNKFAFIPADHIVIEETTDGGATWTVRTVTDAAKRTLFWGKPSGTWHLFPKIDGKTNPLCGLRITITAGNFNIPDGVTDADRMSYWVLDNLKSVERYCSISALYIWNCGIYGIINCSVATATWKNPTVWRDTSLKGSLVGGSGSSFICSESASQITFGSYGTNQPNGVGFWRFTFFETKTGSTGSDGIISIAGVGANVWMSSNNEVSSGHLYSYDTAQNVTFPARLTTPSTLYAEGAQVYAEKPYKLIETITLSEAATIDRSTTPDGDAYSFREVYVLIQRGDTETPSGFVECYCGTTRIVYVFVSALTNANKYGAVHAKSQNGYWYSEQYAVSTSRTNYSGIAPIGDTFILRYPVSSYPSITRVRLTTALAAGTTVKIYAVEA